MLKPLACEYSVRCSSKLLSLKMASVEEVGLLVVGNTYRYSEDNEGAKCDYFLGRNKDLIENTHL